MIGKDGPRRFQVRQAYLSSTSPMEEVRPTETVAFFRNLVDGGCALPEGASGRFRSVRACEILEKCYYPHITKEVRRPSDSGRADAGDV